MARVSTALLVPATAYLILVGPSVLPPVMASGQEPSPAARSVVLADGKPESELWLAKGLTAWRELDAKRLERFGAEMAKLTGCGPQGQQGLLGDYPAWKLVNEGYPVRTVDKSGGGETVEVVKAESRSIPVVEFQPPAGFARKTLREMMGQ